MMRIGIANRVRGSVWVRLTLALACALGMSDAAAAGGATTTPPEVHGVAETYAAPGVSLGWGILHGANEASTFVVVRIATDPAVYPFVAVDGGNPFSQRRLPVLVATRVAGGVDMRVPRSHFADFPRTEFSFYTSSSTMQSGTPQLVVYYLGVPDTAPEFTSEAALDGYLADRIARNQAGPKTKAP
jgi:hypothetical protein